MADRFLLGLDTFGDVTLQSDGTPNSQARVLREVVEEAVLADGLGLDAFGVGEHHRADFAVSAPEVVLAAIAREDQPDPSRIGRHGPEHRRSRACVPAVLDPRRTVEWPRRSHSRSGLVYRVLSVVRIRPVALRGALRGQAVAVCGAVEGRAGDVERLDTHGAVRPDYLSADRERNPQDMDRSRWQPQLGDARGSLWASLDACDHRRQPGALSPVRGSLPPVTGEARPARAARRGALTRSRCGDRRGGAGTSSGRTTRR